jgi:hypothetical protein
MIDIDDAAQVRLFDRRRLLDRASAAVRRVEEAIQSAATVSLPPLPKNPILTLDLPPGLAGVARTIQALAVELGLPPLLLWESHLARLPVPLVILRARPAAPEDGDPVDAPLVDLGAQLNDETHPAWAFTFLLALLEPWMKSSPAGRLYELAQAESTGLACFRPDVPLVDNPAKRIAQGVHERSPFFWAWEPLVGVAQDWSQRMMFYAEAGATWASGDELTAVHVMARHPRYWPRITTFVQLAWNGEPENTADVHVYARRTAGLKLLLQKRGATQLTVFAEGVGTALEAAWYLLELGEWVSLYAAGLYGVDPADRVPLQFLEAVTQ